MKAKKYFFIGLTLLLAIVLIVCVFQYISSTKFTPERWNNDIFGRECMMDDLLSQYDLTSMTRVEILELLGKEGLSFPMSMENLYEGNEIIYYIGRGYVGPMLFSIHFGEDDYVTHYSIYED